MRMMSIASGSSGNCTYIGTDNTHILIDAGVSRKRILEGLNKLDLKAEDIDAVMITHEHDDHIKGIGVLERYCEIPLYSTQGVLDYVAKSKSLGAIPDGVYNTFEAGSTFRIKDLEIKSVPISHDAIDPVAYVVSDGERRAGVVTDLGYYTDEITEAFSDMDVLLAEANHDINMLLTGPYPYPLKQRILGERGHLSNETCGRMLNDILGNRTRKVILGHLSHENNFPELAYETVRMEINLGENGFKAHDFDIEVAKRDTPSDIIKF